MFQPEILITGARSGIGLACVKKCLEEGLSIIGVSRSMTPSEFSHPNLKKIDLDLSQTEELSQKLRGIFKTYPSLKQIILSAGKGLFGHLENLSPLEIRDLLNLNFTAQALIAKSALPFLKRKKEGHLIFIGSEAALEGKKEGSIYCASKFALRGFCQALREEGAKDGVRVTLINPGLVKTPFFDSLHFEPAEGATAYLLPEDIAEAVSYCLRSPSHVGIDEINLSPLVNKVVKKKVSARFAEVESAVKY